MNGQAPSLCTVRRLSMPPGVWCRPHVTCSRVCACAKLRFDIVLLSCTRGVCKSLELPKPMEAGPDAAVWAVFDDKLKAVEEKQAELQEWHQSVLDLGAGITTRKKWDSTVFLSASRLIQKICTEISGKDLGKALSTQAIVQLVGQLSKVQGAQLNAWFQQMKTGACKADLECVQNYQRFVLQVIQRTNGDVLQHLGSVQFQDKCAKPTLDKTFFDKCLDDSTGLLTSESMKVLSSVVLAAEVEKFDVAYGLIWMRKQLSKADEPEDGEAAEEDDLEACSRAVPAAMALASAQKAHLTAAGKAGEIENKLLKAFAEAAKEMTALSVRSKSVDFHDKLQKVLDTLAGGIEVRGKDAADSLQQAIDAVKPLLMDMKAVTKDSASAVRRSGASPANDSSSSRCTPCGE